MTSQYPMNTDGLLLINKPAGLSSARVVDVVKKKLQLAKVGHAGTLDPFATGLLILMIGRATKRFEEFQKLPKEYIATLEFGKETDTLDPEGTIVFQYQKPFEITSDGVKEVLKQFTGTIRQTPPNFSALKVAGTPAYKLARSHDDDAALAAVMQGKTREVTVYESELMESDEKSAVIRFLVSSGTYIRVLARDIGTKLGVGAYLTALTRTKIGTYDIRHAHAPEAVTIHHLIP